MQLESQVGVATAYLSSSDTVPSSTQQSCPISIQQFNSLTNSLNLLIAKLSAIPEIISKSQIVNVFNGSHKPYGDEKASQTTNIHPLITPAPVCDKINPSTADNDVIMESTASSPTHANILTCTLCNFNPESLSQLNQHLEDTHDNQTSSQAKTGNTCQSCEDTFPPAEEVSHHFTDKHATVTLNRETL